MRLVTSTMAPVSDRADCTALVARYQNVRQTTERLCSSLAVKDHVIQAMPDVSPTKWHLGHVSWFFETFLVAPNLAGYEPHNPAYRVLFHSYYNPVGPQFSPPARGHLSRPTVPEVHAFRPRLHQALPGL